MRELTFKGFIRQYVKTLSKYNTENLTKLLHEGSTENARLIEPLLLYAISVNKEQELLNRTKDDKLYTEYYNLIFNYSRENLFKLLQEKSDKLPIEYHKVWHTYQYKKNRHQMDNNTKELIRNKVIYLQQQKSITNYRIYTDLKLNPGNLNAWLKHGYADKVSLDTARRILKFLENINNQ